MIREMVKEGCGIRSIGRLLKISRNTVTVRIIGISRQVEKPPLRIGKSYEMDELKTFLRKKVNEKWVVYAIEKETREVADFRVGRRSKKVLGGVVETLKLSDARRIYTDGFELYRYLIPKEIHSKRPFGINHIERKNLNLRTHLKRLGRKTICFSKSLVMLEACLRIYFWG